MGNVCLCEAPRIKAKFRRTWECTICGKPEQPNTAEAAHPAPATRALAAEAALAAERERVCDVMTAMCEKWLATFSGREINHTPAHEYAEGAVRDIIDQVAAIRAQGTPEC